MKKKFLSLVLILTCAVSYSQTMHSLLFVDVKAPGRAADRTAELQDMEKFCTIISDSLGYINDLRTYSGAEFTGDVMEREIASLNVETGDIVILYYAGHGANYGDDAWPWMLLNYTSKNGTYGYSESEAYRKLKAKTSKAKLTLCIAACCNKVAYSDEQPQKMSPQSASASVIYAKKVKELFIGFEGKLSIIASSSMRGEASYAFTAQSRGVSDKELKELIHQKEINNHLKSVGKKYIGPIYSHNLREVIYEKITEYATPTPAWEAIFQEARERTINDTDKKLYDADNPGQQLPAQHPQHDYN